VKIEIKNRWTGEVIFAHEAEEISIRIAVEEAVKAKVSLSDSDLRGSDLSCSNLRGSDLSGSDVDFSFGWRFACLHSRFTIGMNFAYQVLAHLCSCKCDDPEFAELREKIFPYALKSHRAGDLGLK